MLPPLLPLPFPVPFSQISPRFQFLTISSFYVYVLSKLLTFFAFILVPLTPRATSPIPTPPSSFSPLFSAAT